MRKRNVFYSYKTSQNETLRVEVAIKPMNPDELTPPQFKKAKEEEDRNAAVSVLRSKLDALYKNEPSAKAEVKEVKQLVAIHEDLSKHQLFIKELNDSNKNTAEIQTAWHAYYENLPENEQHEVWEEFYQEQEIIKKKKAEEALVKEVIENKKHSEEPISQRARSRHFDQTKPVRPEKVVDENFKRPKTKIAEVGRHAKKLKENHHVRSLMFGFGMGFLVIFLLLFSFFNERFLVPFIRPSQNVSATPIIVDPNSNGPVGPEAKIIIPKINLEAPVIYDVETIEEKAVQKGLEGGVLHYGTTPNPGEKGNAVIFGHSSGNILNKGKYKFAFILLKSLEENDTFIVQKDGKRYVYKVYNKYVTTPDDVSVLQKGDKESMMTLITCDPPGTSSNRLIVQAEQIFPDPKTNKASSVDQSVISQPQELPSNSQSLWDRIF